MNFVIYFPERNFLVSNLQSLFLITAKNTANTVRATADEPANRGGRRARARDFLESNSALTAVLGQTFLKCLECDDGRRFEYLILVQVDSEEAK